MIYNPVLPGFCPDPSVVRVGEDYYIAVSTFEWWPGVRIYHTKDLRHYRQLPSPLCRKSQLNMEGNPDSCGIWAPDLTYADGKFWLVFTDVKTRDGSRYYNTHNYVVWTTDIEGEWSEPVYLNSTGFDPSLFHDTDGKSYFVNMVNGFGGIQVCEFDREEKKLVGQGKIVCKGTGRKFTEGPHIYHIGDWYYLMMAEGGTSYEHCETMCRSKNLWGDYEADPGNPILTSDRENPAALQKCGHADLVCTQNGEWYLFHLCSRPDGGGNSILGRETAVQNVYWNEEGWLRLSCGGRYGQMTAQPPKGIPEATWDQQEDGGQPEGKRSLYEFTTLRIPAEGLVSFDARKGWIRLYGKEFPNSCFQVSLLAKKQEKKKSGMICGMEFTPESERQGAGAVYYYDTANFFLLILTCLEDGTYAVRVLESRNRGVQVIGEKRLSDCPARIHLKIETDDTGEHATYMFSLDGIHFEEIASAATDILSDEHCVGFTGAHFGIHCHDMDRQTKTADFQYFTIL